MYVLKLYVTLCTNFKHFMKQGHFYTSRKRRRSQQAFKNVFINRVNKLAYTNLRFKCLYQVLCKLVRNLISRKKKFTNLKS